MHALLQNQEPFVHLQRMIEGIPHIESAIVEKQQHVQGGPPPGGRGEGERGQGYRKLWQQVTKVRLLDCRGSKEYNQQVT